MKRKRENEKRKEDKRERIFIYEARSLFLFQPFCFASKIINYSKRQLLLNNP